MRHARRPIRRGGTRRALFALLLALPLFALVAPGAAAQRSSGLYGTVRRGPVMPVCRVGVPCDAAAANVLLIFRAGGVVRMARSGKGGVYRVALPAGRYQVTTDAKLFGRVPRPSAVLVRGGPSEHVDFAIDTGIR